MIVLIDNYDSFTYNLYQYMGEINENIIVIRNDKASVDDIMNMKPSHIIISPGPGFPIDSGISIDLIKRAAGIVPLLGVCLGHQAIGEAFGGIVTHSKNICHGKSSRIRKLNECKIFDGLPEVFIAGRYHSLIVEKDSLPEGLIITALTLDGEIMGLKALNAEVYGIQFHPESVLTPEGKRIIKNFLEIASA